MYFFNKSNFCSTTVGQVSKVKGHHVALCENFVDLLMLEPNVFTQRNPFVESTMFTKRQHIFMFTANITLESSYKKKTCMRRTFFFSVRGQISLGDVSLCLEVVFTILPQMSPDHVFYHITHFHEPDITKLALLQFHISNFKCGSTVPEPNITLLQFHTSICGFGFMVP